MMMRLLNGNPTEDEIIGMQAHFNSQENFPRERFYPEQMGSSIARDRKYH
jgi:hypothetical protein